MDFLSIPGASLLGGDKLIFDEVKINVDKATNDFLIRPDWDANLRCVELISPIANQELLAEVSLLLRKKLRSSTPKVVVMTLRLMESLVNNCKVPWYMALNNERNTRELANVARTYSKRNGPENREVAETALDIIQAWGEAFLTRQKQFPNIVQLYFDLRKEGLPFKVNNQFDPNRVPIFNAAPSSSGLPRDNTDGILAAAMQSSLQLERERSNSRSAPASSGGDRARSYMNNYQNTPPPTRRASSNASAADSSSFSPNEIIESMATSIALLKDLISTCFNVRDLVQNDIAEEIAAQLQAVQGRVSGAIESAMSGDPEILDALFQVNDLAQTVLQIYKDMKDGKKSLEEGKKVLFPEEAQKAAPTTAAPVNTSANLLDYDQPPSTAVPAAKSSPITKPPSADPFATTPAKPSSATGTPVVTASKSQANKNISSNIVNPNDDPFGPSTSSFDDPFGPSKADPFADFVAKPAAAAPIPNTSAQSGKGNIDLDALFGAAPAPTPGYYAQAPAYPPAYPGAYPPQPYPQQPYHQPYPPAQMGMYPAPPMHVQQPYVNSSFPAPPQGTPMAQPQQQAAQQQAPVNNPFDIFE